MSESKTPRTDAHFKDICFSQRDVEFAKALEQELERQYEENVHRIAEQAKAENERDQLKELIEKEKCTTRHICGAHLGNLNGCPACERDQLKAEVEKLERQRNTGLETISRLAGERDQWLNDGLAPGLESPMLERYNKLKEGKSEENDPGFKLRTRKGA